MDLNTLMMKLRRTMWILRTSITIQKVRLWQCLLLPIIEAGQPVISLTCLVGRID